VAAAPTNNNHCHDAGNTQENDEQEIKENERTTAIFSCHKSEAPDIAQTNSAAHGGKNKAPARGKPHSRFSQLQLLF
jgi:hypothetical protein